MKIKFEIPDTFPFSRVEVWPQMDDTPEEEEDRIYVCVFVSAPRLYAYDFEELRKAMEKCGFVLDGFEVINNELNVRFSKEVGV